MIHRNVEEIIADTSHEAFLNANERYGQDQFEVIESKKFIVSKCFGIVKKERHRLVVKLKPDTGLSITSSGTGTGFASPAKAGQALPPMPKLPKTGNSQSTSDSLDIPIPDFITDEGLPRLQTKAEKLTYSFRELHKPRPVNGLRDIQEGSAQPIQQKLKKTSQDDNSSRMLEQLIEIKNRTRVEPVLRPSAKPSLSVPSFPAPNTPAGINVLGTLGLETAAAVNPGNNGVINVQLLRQFESMMLSLQETLKNINHDASLLTKQQDHVVCLPKGLQSIKQCLLAMETPLAVAQEIINDIARTLPLNDQNHPLRVAKAYEDWCTQRFKFSNDLSFGRKGTPKIIALVGPTGVGKTTTIAKLAAQYALDSRHRKNVAFFTLDTYRIGAADQLEHYAQHLGSTLEIIYDCNEIPQKLLEHQDKDLIIVDTAGRCQKDTKELKNLYNFLNQMPNVVKYLVLSATSKYADMKESTENFKIVGYDRLIFTKLDETNTIGPLLGIMASQDSPLAYITDGQTVPTDIKKASFDCFYHDLLANSLVFD